MVQRVKCIDYFCTICEMVFFVEGENLNIEYEARLLNIDIISTIERLEQLNAKRIGTFYQKRLIYDLKPPKEGKWIRLRSNGKESTLTIKEIKTGTIDGTHELEINVSDFDDTIEILRFLGYLPRSFQENFRIEYDLNGVRFDLDKWPMIPPLLEIEGNSELSVLSAFDKLGISDQQLIYLDVQSIYQQKYNINLNDFTELKFCKEELTFIEKWL